MHDGTRSRSAVGAALMLAGLVLGHLLLRQLFRYFVPESGLLDALLFSALFGLCLWVCEVGPARRAAANDRARTAALVEASAESVIMLDPRGLVVSLNTAAEILLMRREAELQGRCIHAVEGLEELSGLCGCTETLRPAYRSGRIVSNLASHAVIDWLTTPLPLEGGGGLVLSMRDVTSEVMALERAQLQAAALDTAANSIFITGTDGRIKWVNSAFKTITGYGDEVIGQTPRILKSGKYDEAFYRQLWATITGGQPWAGEMVNRRRDGSLFTCLATITPVNVAGGAATHFVAVAQDVTRQRELEKRLSVAERMASLGTLAAGVAHEINNPLAFITSNLEYVRTYIEKGEGDPADVIPALTDANMGAERVRKIVHALRTFSWVGDGPKRSVDVRGALDHALTIAGSQLRSRAKVTMDLGPTPAVVGDEGRLSQVFLNLLVNAGQAIAAGNPGANEVKVASSVTENGEVLVEISDTGSGISEATRKHLFEPFFTTKPVGVGTGLGLYICHNLIHGMGGEISVDSVVGKGTTFRVRLPPEVSVERSAAAA